MKVPIEDIKVPKERTRSVLDLHSDEMLELVESIKAVGLINPITVDKERNLIAGERRLMACRMAGLSMVDIRINESNQLLVEIEENVHRKELSWPDRARAEARLFNQMEKINPGWTKYKQAALTKQSLYSLSTFLRLGRALPTKPYLEEYATPTEALRLLKEEEEREEALPGLPDHVVHAPDWATDRYVVGDALEGMRQFIDSAPQARGQACHLAWVDPPHRKTYEPAKPSPDYWQHFETLYRATAQLAYECVHPNAFGLFWYEMEEHEKILSILREVGWVVAPHPGIWVKHQISQTPKPDALLGTCFEPFYVARKGKPRLGRPGRGNVFMYGESFKIQHAEKPYQLCKEIVRTFLFPGSRVMDVFAGSGNMIRAATAAGHIAFGWDMVPERKEGFLKRVEEDRVRFDKKQEELGRGV